MTTLYLTRPALSLPQAIIYSFKVCFQLKTSSKRWVPKSAVHMKDITRGSDFRAKEWRRLGNWKPWTVFQAWWMAIWCLYTFCTLRFLPGQVVLLPGRGTSWLTRSSHLEFKGFLSDPSPIIVCHCIVATLRCHFGPWIDSPNNWCWRGRRCWCWYRCRYQSYKY